MTQFRSYLRIPKDWLFHSDKMEKTCCKSIVETSLADFDNDLREVWAAHFKMRNHSPVAALPTIPGLVNVQQFSFFCIHTVVSLSFMTNDLSPDWKTNNMNIFCFAFISANKQQSCHTVPHYYYYYYQFSGGK